MAWHSDFTKFNFGPGSAPVPTGGAYDAPPDLLVGWGGGHPLPIPHPLDAFGVLPTVPHHFSKPSAAPNRRLSRLDASISAASPRQHVTFGSSFYPSSSDFQLICWTQQAIRNMYVVCFTYKHIITLFIYWRTVQQ